MNSALLGTSCLAAGLGLVLTLSSPGEPRESEPQAAPVEAPVDAGAEIVWRTDLAAAMAEARRSKRPLLAVFR